MRLASATANGFGNDLGTFGARTAASAATLPLPLRSRNRANERTPARFLISERQLRKFGKRDRLAKMIRQEVKKLLHVAPIGFERFGRHAPLVG
jgi:hypothetical protein